MARQRTQFPRRSSIQSVHSRPLRANRHVLGEPFTADRVADDMVRTAVALGAR